MFKNGRFLHFEALLIPLNFFFRVTAQKHPAEICLDITIVFNGIEKACPPSEKIAV